MGISKKSLSFFIGALFLLLVHESLAESAQKLKDKQMESFLPFLFMMGGGAPLHGAAACMVGGLSLVAMVAVELDHFLLREIPLPG